MSPWLFFNTSPSSTTPLWLLTYFLQTTAHDTRHLRWSRPFLVLPDLPSVHHVPIWCQGCGTFWKIVITNFHNFVFTHNHLLSPAYWCNRKARLSYIHLTLSIRTAKRSWSLVFSFSHGETRKWRLRSEHLGYFSSIFLLSPYVSFWIYQYTSAYWLQS